MVVGFYDFAGLYTNHKKEQRTPDTAAARRKRRSMEGHAQKTLKHLDFQPQSTEIKLEGSRVKNLDGLQNSNFAPEFIM
jgi:hypothetical protein